jgi:predicted DNA-binding transcriptional regulator AlpA
MSELTAQRRQPRLAVTPRLLTRQQAAEYCGLSPAGFSMWIKQGRLPGPILGTNRWDLRAIDRALDALSNIQYGDSGAALDIWKAKHAVHLKGVHRVKARLANRGFGFGSSPTQTFSPSSAS